MKLIIFIYALLLGSFYNVVGLRIPLKQSIVRPRSACPECGWALSIGELIPVLSFIIQKGKCRKCGKRIFPIYPMIELLTASLFFFAYIKLGWSFELVVAWALISLLVIISISDFTYMLIPDKILLVFAGIFIILRVVQPLAPWWDSIIGATVAFLLLLIIAIVSKGGMGGGDIKLYTVIGFVLGLKPVLVAFFLANLIGTTYGLIGMTIGFFERKKPIPFGPFIAVGTLIVYFFDETILSWYISFF